MNTDKFKEYAKLIRIQLLGASVTAVIGALSVKGGALEPSDFILLFVMGILGTIAGYVLNDYSDINIDKLSEELSNRPLVKGTISRRAALITIFSCMTINFIILFIFFCNTLPISIRIISVILGVTYNVFSKRIPGSDFIVAGSMAMFCLFGAVAVSGNIQSLHDVGNLTWIVVSLVFVHVLFLNAIEGSLKDVKNDRKAGIKTFAIYLGVKTSEKMHIPISFKAIAVLLNILTIILVFLPFLFFGLNFWIWQIICLIILLIGILWLTVKLLTIKSFDRKIIGRYAVRQEVIRYSLVPIMLIGVIGMTWSLFLILLPLVWLLLFRCILRDELPTLTS